MIFFYCRPDKGSNIHFLPKLGQVKQVLVLLNLFQRVPSSRRVQRTSPSTQTSTQTISMGFNALISRYCLKTISTNIHMFFRLSAHVKPIRLQYLNQFFKNTFACTESDTQLVVTFTKEKGKLDIQMPSLITQQHYNF